MSVYSYIDKWDSDIDIDLDTDENRLVVHVNYDCMELPFSEIPNLIKALQDLSNGEFYQKFKAKLKEKGECSDT